MALVTAFSGVVHKSSSGMSMVFPNVCYTPSPVGGGVPIPYPNFATTAAAKQQKAGVKGPVANPLALVKGATSLVGSAPKGKIEGEAAQLRGLLNTLHSQLQALPAKDPNQWQDILQRYAAAASALYLTRRDD